MATGICTGPECERTVRTRGLCASHYRQLRVKGELKVLRGQRKPCRMDDCESISHAKGLCPKHYYRLLSNGSPSAVAIEEISAVRERLILGVKKCAECQEVKDSSEFYRSAANRDGLTYFCKICSSVKQSTWHAANREANRKRRHTRRKRESAGSGIDLDLLWFSSDGKCPDCATTITRSAKFREPEFGSIDHIIPLSKGGEHAQHNVRLTCLPCNLRKGTKILQSEIN